MTESVSMINNRFRRQALVWLVTAMVMLILWFLVSIFNKAPTPAKEHKKTQVVADDFALPTTIDNLNELSREVPPIDFETVVRDLRNYPAQFKGKKFFQDNEKRWTVQVMDVAQNDIVAEYLKGRNDRDKFSYFRYHTPNNEQRYVLTYGVMGSRQEALGAIKSVDFNLPKSIDFTAVEMKNYVGMMDDYERSETIIDSSESSPRIVKLKETKKEIPAEAPKKETPKEVSKEKPKPKTVEKEKIADLGDEGGEAPTKAQNSAQSQTPTQSKPKMPPTAVPKDISDKPKENKKDHRAESKSETRTEKVAKSEPKPAQKSSQETNVADLEPAPPMNMPGDD